MAGRVAHGTPNAVAGHAGSGLRRHRKYGLLRGMADTTDTAAKSPWHVWVVGVIALLWNATGALDFTMTQLHNEAWLKAMTPEQQTYIYAFPLWAVLAWGVGTWGGLLGSLLILLRRGFAVNLFAASLVCVVITDLYSYCFSDCLKVMGGGAGMVAFSVVIFVIALLLFLYSRALRRRGVLRG